MCDSGKGENFCERSKKEQSARKISRCARNDGMGGSKSPRNVGWRQAVLSVSSYRAQESQSSDKSNQ